MKSYSILLNNILQFIINIIILGGVKMVSFILAIIALIVGYFIYGTIVEKTFGADEKIQTPAIRLEDGVDFVRCLPGRFS